MAKRTASAGATTKPAKRSDRKPVPGLGVAKRSLAFEATTDEAAQVLVQHLFAQNDFDIPGISYAVGYKLAEGHTGGDIVDVYNFDNNAVAVAIADIAGKGPRAAVHAAMIKYSLRAYSSAGMTPEKVVCTLDRLYLENNAFEKMESFASVFFGIIDPTRRFFNYSCAGHEPVFLVRPDGTPAILPPTAPLIGVFDDAHDLFKEAFIEVSSGTLFVGASDGVTEARNRSGELYGMDRLITTAQESRDESPDEIVKAVLKDVERFCKGKRRDDIAVVVVRFQ